jgi:hypothetical protein
MSETLPRNEIVQQASRKLCPRRGRSARQRAGKLKLRFQLWFLMLLVVYIGIVFAICAPRWRNPPHGPKPQITRFERIYPDGRVQRSYVLYFSTGGIEKYSTDAAPSPVWKTFEWTHGKERSVDATSSEPWPKGAAPVMRSTYVELEKMFDPPALAALEQSREAKIGRNRSGPYSDQSYDKIITITWEAGDDVVDDLRAVHQRTGRPN